MVVSAKTDKSQHNRIAKIAQHSTIFFCVIGVYLIIEMQQISNDITEEAVFVPQSIFSIK